MYLSDTRKTSLMAYCRIDELGPGEDQLLEDIYHDAVSYLAGAGVAQPPAYTERRAQYDMCINALVLDAWDNRGTQFAGYSVVDNPAWQRKKNQLKLTEPVS